MIRRLLAAAVLCLAGCAAGENPRVDMVTNKGTIKIELYESKAPNTVKNFLQYVDDKFYDGKIFHRVIPTFMIQTGGFEPGMEEPSTRGPIANESANGLRNERGTLAMARTPNPHSASAQFFINVKDNDFLDKANAQDGWGYCVFGKVIDDASMKVVDTIRKVKTTNVKGHDDVPVEDVVIESIRRVPAK